MDSTKSRNDSGLKSSDKIEGRNLFAINYDLSANAHLFGKTSLDFTVYYDQSMFCENESDSENEDLRFSSEILIEDNTQPLEPREVHFSYEQSGGNLPESPETDHFTDDQHMEEISVKSEDLQNEIQDELSISTDVTTDQCFLCPYCLNSLDSKSFFIHTDVSNYVCPICNMPFSRKLLIDQNTRPREPSCTPDQSFSSFPGSPESHVSELVEWFEDLQDENDVSLNEDLDNSTRHVDQTDQINNIEVIEIDDDDDDNDYDDDVFLIDAAAADDDDDYDDVFLSDAAAADDDDDDDDVFLCDSNGKNSTSNVCMRETHSSDRDYDTFPTQGPSTSLDQSNSTSERGRWVKLVSDFDDFAERPFACTLCYQRYSEFRQLSIHVKNHLTGAGDFNGVQTLTPPPF